jgi:hypothetical protein
MVVDKNWRYVSFAYANSPMARWIWATSNVLVLAKRW